MKGKVIVVVGGQYGSEGKGGVVAAICNHYATAGREVMCVRTGAINAGHTVYYDVPAPGGNVAPTAFKMQQIPCGWVHPDVRLVIGRGAYIHKNTLAQEVAELHRAGVRVRDRLYIDAHAHLHTAAHELRAREADRHLSIGSVGKGCSESVIGKIRGRADVGFTTYGATGDSEFKVDDASMVINDAYDRGAVIVVEGTQGTLLDLHHGNYPFVTSRMTTAANWLAEAGISPGLDIKVVMVLRTYPIRVAGNSGPMPSETSWSTLFRCINRERLAVGLSPLIEPAHLDLFDLEVRRVLQSMNAPDDMHRWSAATREYHRKAASTAHATALGLLPAHVRSEIDEYFEMTTVTRKLRRVAYLDDRMTRYAVRIERPVGVIATFANYLYPEAWAWDGPSGWREFGPGCLTNAYTGLGNTPIIGASYGRLQTSLYIDFDKIGV